MNFLQRQRDHKIPRGDHEISRGEYSYCYYEIMRASHGGRCILSCVDDENSSSTDEISHGLMVIFHHETMR